MERPEVFAAYVREVLRHLYDPSVMQAHPLAALLLPGRPPSATALRDTVTRAIQELRQAPGTPPSAAHRRHQHLVLRYLEGYSLEETARRLMVSVRQARRDHAEAVSDLTALLWERYQQPPRPAPGPVPAPPKGGPVEGAGDGLEAELARLQGAAEERPTEVAEILQETLSTLAGLAQRHGVRFEPRVPPGLPPFAQNRVVLRQILLNLFMGAAGLAPAAPPRQAQETRIEVSAAGEDGHIVLRLRFLPPGGHRGDPPESPAAAEAQAALAVSRRLAELEGGTLQTVRDAHGVWGLDLPLPAAPAPTVLVIDDNPDVVRLFRRFLAGRDIRLTQATNAEAGLDLARKLRPDVVILDVLLPSQDGWEILHGLRAQPETAHVPVVVCSVLHEKTLALSLGADDFLAKPVSQHALVAALERSMPDPAGQAPHRSSRPSPPAGEGTHATADDECRSGPRDVE
ncbi:MAG TPA: response regulator [Chloroflexota bacterium]|nr:response regulator [Chloroflexota bacterium]